MNVNDKKSLALLISYVDKLVEEQFTSRLEAIESLVESSPLVLSEDGQLFFIEGPKGNDGERGPRGFRGPQGEQGNDGRDADPVEVAKLLRVDESFVKSVIGPKGDKGDNAKAEDVIEKLLSDETFLESVRGPRGLEGPAGKDADVKKIVESLKRSKLFKEEVRGPKGKDGERGPAGDIGPPGVGIHSLNLNNREIVVEKTDGSVDKFQLPLLEQFDSSVINKELETLRKELARIRSDVTAQITRSIMSAGAGSSSGGGEVRIEFMDDFVRSSLINGDGKPVVWNEKRRKFQLGGLADIEGVIAYKTQTNPYLIGNGNSALIQKGVRPLLVNEFYSLFVVDPIDNKVVSSSVYSPDGFIQIDSNESLVDKIFYLNYRQGAPDYGPFLTRVNVNNYLSNGGLRVEIPFSDYDIYDIETIRLLDDNKDVEAVITLTDRIIIESNVPMFGLVVEMMVNNNSFQGNPYLTIPLSGTSVTIDFISNNIENVINYMVLDNAGELQDVVVYLTDNNITFQSGAEMTGKTLKLWYLAL